MCAAGSFQYLKREQRFGFLRGGSIFVLQGAMKMTSPGAAASTTTTIGKWPTFHSIRSKMIYRKPKAVKHGDYRTS